MNTQDNNILTNAADVVINLRAVTRKEAADLGGDAEGFMVVEILKNRRGELNSSYLRKVSVGEDGYILEPVDTPRCTN